MVIDWDLLLQGLEGGEIARREGVDPAVISRMKTRVERRLIAETQDNAAAFRVRQIGELRRARREASLSRSDTDTIRRFPEGASCHGTVRPALRPPRTHPSI
jgi:hypothetical protein